MAAVIFDLDGTLVDSVPDIHAAVNRMLADAGEAPLTQEAVRRFVGNGVPVLIDRVLAARGHAPDALRHAQWQQRFLTVYEAASADLTQVYPGVVQALDRLKSQGHALGICTNKPLRPAQNVLQAFGLDRFFKHVIGGDSLPDCKPHPAPLLAAARALGPGPVIFVGDSEVDAETAVAAGFPFVLYTEGYRNSTAAALPQAARFGHYDDLSDVIAGLLRN